MSSSSAAPPPIDYASGDHYAVLGVPREASEAEITRAYKALARQYHPDKNLDRKEQAEIAFKRIAEAYAVLKDPQQRMEYDAAGRGGSRSYVSYEEADRIWRNFGSDDEEDEIDDAQARQQANRRLSGLLAAAVVLFYAPDLLSTMLPAIVLVFVVAAVLSRGGGLREQGQALGAYWQWCLLAFIVFGFLVPRYLRSRSAVGEPIDVRFPRSPLAGGNAGQLLPPQTGRPHSGEEVLLPDGSFIRMPDPLKADGSFAEGWQRRLVADLEVAVKDDRSQVVLMWSRDGCPWCDRQLPVLQDAMLFRAAQIDSGFGQEGDTQRPASAVDAAADLPLLRAPLRIFVFDAREFYGMAEMFRIEAFPTTFAWGPWKSMPLRATGYLDPQELDSLLHKAAGLPPQAEEDG